MPTPFNTSAVNKHSSTGDMAIPDEPAPYTNFYTPENSEYYARIHYQSLDKNHEEIRLLQIDLSNAGRYKMLQAVPLGALAIYSAISYFSGDPGNTITVEIDGIKMNIFANLARAISEAIGFWKKKLPDQPMLLWVDQICINQSDAIEKSQQVNFMREIYRRATFVYVSMPIERDLRSSFDWLSSLEKRLSAKGYKPETAMLYQNIPEESRRRMIDGREIEMETDDNGTWPGRYWEDLHRVLNHPWWSRSWVYQEFIVASQVFFLFSENFWMQWEDLHPLLDLFIRLDTSKACETAIHKRDWAQKKMQRYQILASPDIITLRLRRAGEAAFCCCRWWLEDKCSWLYNKPSDYDGCWSYYCHWCPGFCCGESCGECCDGCYDDCCEEDCVDFAAEMASIDLEDNKCGSCTCGACCFPCSVVCAIPWLLSAAVFSVPWTLGCGCFYKARRTRAALVGANRKGLEDHLQRLSNQDIGRALVSRVMQGKLQWKTKQSANLSYLLRHAQNTATSQPKDKFYAFIGLTNLRDKITINYSPAYTMNTVLTDVARAIIAYEDAGLDILAQAGTAAPRRRLPQGSDPLPSWVPDWDRGEDVEREKFIHALSLPPNCAAGRSSAALTTFSADRFDNEGRVLEAQGIMITTLGTALEIGQDTFRRWVTFQSSDGFFQVTTTVIAHVGDEVWVLHGMKWPVVLRRSSVADTTTLLSIANVSENGQAHKVMFGNMQTRDIKRVKII